MDADARGWFDPIDRFYTLPHLALTPSGRNADKGPGRHQSVSGLSPYLRHRLLLDDEVLHSVLARHSLTSAEKFIDEVFWRSYFKGWLEHHPRVWSSYVEDCESLRRGLREDARLQLAFSDAIWGRTGIGPFDAWVRELRATGYLHNHARMWFASVWIFNAWVALAARRVMVSLSLA